MIGKKIRGFKFDSRPNFGYPISMNKYIGKIGTIIELGNSDTYKVEFDDDSWYYPKDLCLQHLVEEENTKDKYKEIEFAEWLAQNHYILNNLENNICWWKNEYEEENSALLYSKFLSEKTNDSIVESIIKQFKERSNVGINKYGVTLDRTDLTRLEWINHAQQEAMDMILYLEKLKTYEK